jgi:hypothetical protein
VVAKVRGRLAVNKKISHRFNMGRFNLKKLNEEEGKEQYRVEVSHRSAALEDLDTDVEVVPGKLLERICTKLLDQRKQAKL